MIALAYPPYDPGMDRFSGWVYLAVFVLLAAAMACVTDLPPFPVRLHGRRGLRAPVAEEEGPALPASGPDPAPEPWQVPVPRGRHAARADLLTVTWDETRGMYL